MNNQRHGIKGLNPWSCPNRDFSKECYSHRRQEGIPCRLRAALPAWYGLTFSKWIFAPANSTKQATESSCKFYRFKRLSCCWSVPVKSSRAKSSRKGFGLETHLWTSITASTPPLRNCAKL